MDKLRISLQFEKYLYTCSLGHELLVDDRTKTYNCPQCGQKLGEGWYRNVGDSLSMSLDEYNSLSPEDIEKKKSDRIEANIVRVKTPIPIYIETPEEIQAQIDSKLAEVVELGQRKVEAEAKLEIETIKDIK